MVDDDILIPPTEAVQGVVLHFIDVSKTESQVSDDDVVGRNIDRISRDTYSGSGCSLSGNRNIVLS